MTTKISYLCFYISNTFHNLQNVLLRFHTHVVNQVDWIEFAVAYRCAIPSLDGAASNLTDEEILNYTIPYDASKKVSRFRQLCQMIYARCPMWQMWESLPRVADASFKKMTSEIADR